MNDKMNKADGVGRSLMALFAASAFVMAVGVLVLILLGSYLARDHFDPETWGEYRSEGRHAKCRTMAVDIVRRDLLKDMDREGVAKLLGKPDWERKSSSLYNLGPERGSLFPADDDWLVVDFGENGRVTHCVIRPD
ncbi:MAG: hypothetical protein ACYTFG_05835 [Planctomycetota bacterium]|jgi:hypothetical protein